MTAIKLGQESDLTCVFALTGTSDFNSKMLYIIVMAPAVIKSHRIISQLIYLEFRT